MSMDSFVINFEVHSRDKPWRKQQNGWRWEAGEDATTATVSLTLSSGNDPVRDQVVIPDQGVVGLMRADN